MSDDTPTQRLGADGGDAPTEILATPADETAPLVAEERKNRRLIIILASIGGTLLLALLIVLILLLTQGNAAPGPAPTATGSASASPTPSPTATQSATPTPTPTPTPTETVAPPPPPPPPPSEGIQSFDVDDKSVDCDGENSVTAHFEWHAIGETLWFGVGTDNAKLQPYAEYPLNYSMDFEYQCGQSDGQQKYTITVEKSNGSLAHKTIVIRED